MRYKATSPFARTGTPPRPSELRSRPKRPDGPRDRVRDWIATAPLLLLAVIVLVGDPARAAVPALSYRGMAMAGQRIDVSGTGFLAGTAYQLRWDGDAHGMPRVRATADGSFATPLKIPNTAAPGPHRVDATAIRSRGRASQPAAAVAAMTVDVMAPHVSPPTPAATPTVSPPTPPAQTPVATPHVDHTPIPTAQPPVATPMPTMMPGGDHHGMADPVACTGYPERRVFLESQGWWLQTPGAGGTDFGHVHVGMCFPQGQRVRGVVTLDVRLVMHDNPGTLTRLYGGIETDGGGYDLWNVPVGLTCPTATCTVWTQLRVDTTAVATDGRVEWRFRPQVRTPDGLTFTPSTGWQTYLVNGGRPVADYRSQDSAIARGWYENAGYANASISSVPMSPISGTWTANVTLDRGSDGNPVTFHGIYIDPDFHMGSKGIVIREGTGPYRGTVTINAAGLSAGTHRLVLRSDAIDPRGSTNSGILVVFFVVDH
jgi:hypothetical protein